MDETKLTHRLTRFFRGKPARAEPSTPETTSKQSQPTIEKKANDSTVNLSKPRRAKNMTSKSTDTSRGRRILVIPDTQVKPGVNTDHLEWAGQYAVKMKPDVIVHIGDHWDMPSLSSYDKKGSRQMEGRRYVEDVDSGNMAMDRFMAPIHAEVARLKKGKRKAWEPRLVFTLGNHEERIKRAADSDPQLGDLISVDDFNLAEHGFEVYPFLEPVVIDGIVFVHFVCSGVMGRSISSARAGLTKRHQSFFQGHVQSRDIAEGVRADGKRITGIMGGSFYTHMESYLSPQYNTGKTWSGVWVLHGCDDGEFDYMPVSIDYLRSKYE